MSSDDPAPTASLTRPLPAPTDPLFRLLVESVKDYAIFMLDPTGRVASWNQGAAHIKGYRADEIIGQHFSVFYPQEDVRAGKCERELEGAARDGRFEDEGWRLRKDGSRFWANVVITALRDGSGKLVGFAKVTRDLTERKSAEDARLRAGEIARRRIDAVASLSEVFADASSVDDVGRAVVERAVGFAGADFAVLLMFDEQGEALELIQEQGCNPKVTEAFRRVTHQSNPELLRIAAAGRGVVWAETQKDSEAVVPVLAAVGDAHDAARACLFVPLIADAAPLGLLGIGFFGERRFTEEERVFAGTFGRVSAQALGRFRSLAAERAAAARVERLRASLSTTLRSIGDAVIVTDERGLITLMNGVAQRLTGWSESEAIGRPLPEVFRIINEQTRAIVESPVEKVLSLGKVVGLANHTVLIAKEGREIPIDDSGAPIREEGQAVAGVVLVFRDVSERKHDETQRAFLAEAAATLANSRDYQKTVGKVAELAVPRLADYCAVDLCADGERNLRRLAVAHIDPAKVKLAQEFETRWPTPMDAPAGVPNVLRTGKPELLATITDEMLVAGCRDAEQLEVARALGLHSAMVVPLTIRERVRGAITFVFAESGRVYGEDDLRFAEELAWRCASAIENAELFSLEQKARRDADATNRAKDDFLAIVSHELRTPLNAIMGWAKLVTAKEHDEKWRKAALETIERNAVAMGQLVEDLLDMSRAISGRMRLDVQRVDLARVLEAAIDSIRPAVSAKGVALVASIEQSARLVSGDPTRLQQVVWNLLSNAVKFTQKGGRVDVSMRQVGSALEVAVADNGKGIVPDFLPHVFDAFRQQDASPSRSGGGLGLGLAITKQIVELHGGTITARSEGEGRGSRFVVSLPIAAVITTTEPPVRPPPEFQREIEKPEILRGLHVLAVDDEPDARHLVKLILEDCGCSVETASDADQAMKRIAERVPDIILSDIGMPGVDGYQLMRRIRALPSDKGGEVPAAALTAYARAEDRRRALNAGFSIHLPKPVEPAELVAVVATLARFARRTSS